MDITPQTSEEEPKENANTEDSTDTTDKEQNTPSEAEEADTGQIETEKDNKDQTTDNQDSKQPEEGDQTQNEQTETDNEEKDETNPAPTDTKPKSEEEDEEDEFEGHTDEELQALEEAKEARQKNLDESGLASLSNWLIPGELEEVNNLNQLPDKYRLNKAQQKDDQEGFEDDGYSIPPGFYSNQGVRKKFCNENPTYRFCNVNSSGNVVLKSLKSLGAEVFLAFFGLFFILVCVVFFFRMPVYLKEISDAVSNGYMELYEKQNPAMVVTKLELEKLEKMQMLFMNCRPYKKKKKNAFLRMFTSKKKGEKEREADEAAKLEKQMSSRPKTHHKVLDTFDGRQYEIDNKNLSPVVVTFKPLKKNFNDVSEFVQTTIQQDTIYFEIEIEKLLGSTDIILGTHSYIHLLFYQSLIYTYTSAFINE